MFAAAPFYIHPAVDEAAWRRLRDGQLGLAWAVINIADGPGSQPDPHYYGPALADGSRTPLRGYVDLDYGGRPVAAVVADAEAWRAWYGVEALMLDRAPSRADALGTATEALAALRRAGFSRLAANPGTIVDAETAALYRDADLLCEAEHDWKTYRTLSNPTRGGWHIVHSVPSEKLADAAGLAAARGATHAWVTDRAMPNPYDALPTGW